MPMPFRDSDNAEVPIGTHGIFIRMATHPFMKEIGFIHVTAQDDELRWHDFTQNAPSPPRDVFYALFDHSNGDPESTTNIWKKYDHSDLEKEAAADAPSTDDGDVWAITFGSSVSTTLTDEPVSHPYAAGSNAVGYLSIDSSQTMKWWIKEAAVKKKGPNNLTRGLVKFNKTLNAGQRCLHFKKLTATEIGNITAEQFFTASHDPLT